MTKFDLFTVEALISLLTYYLSIIIFFICYTYFDKCIK